MRANATKIKVNSTVKALNLILNEETDFDMAVLKKFKQLLSDNLPVISIHLLAHLNKPRLRIDHIFKCARALNQALQHIEMLKSNLVKFFRLHRKLNLILDAHNHEVKQLLHTCVVQFHDRAVRKLLKNHLRRVH